MWRGSSRKTCAPARPRASPCYATAGGWSCPCGSGRGRLRLRPWTNSSTSIRRAAGCRWSTWAVVRMAPETAERLRDLPKGDALATAELAGVMAAKRTSDLIPLCHQLPLSVVRVTAAVAEGAVEITAEAETVAQTGVEMEALVAASVAALTVYDMAKAIDKTMVVEEVRLLEKTKEPL